VGDVWGGHQRVLWSVFLIESGFGH
jgi:hypothetical protein